jgi:hypothetical protein
MTAANLRSHDERADHDDFTLTSGMKNERASDDVFDDWPTGRFLVVALSMQDGAGLPMVSLSSTPRLYSKPANRWQSSGLTTKMSSIDKTAACSCPIRTLPHDRQNSAEKDLCSAIKAAIINSYAEHVLQADKRCDRNFLAGSGGSIVVHESH